MARVFAPLILVASLVVGGCVHVDPNTGKTKPRGHQRYKYEVVKRQAKNLKEGMSKYNVLMLLGSPAEESGDKDVWVYLPERPAVLIPSSALRLYFENGVLKEHGYRPIILGGRW